MWLNLTQDEIDQALNQRAFIKKWENKHYSHKLIIAKGLQDIREQKLSINDFPELVKNAIVLTCIDIV